MKFKQLNFKKEYGKMILSGRKITTIRRSTNLRPGDIVELIAGGESCGYAKVLSVKKKKVSELSDEDAVRDGFKDIKELIKALKKHYHKIKPEMEVYIISFEKTDLSQKISKKKAK